MHPQALCEAPAVGAAPASGRSHTSCPARLGEDCNVCDHVFIENDVVIGDRVTIKSGVQLWDGLRVADDVFIGPNATFSNDKYPRSKQYQSHVRATHIDRGASIGGGAVILPGIRIGARAMVGAGADRHARRPGAGSCVGQPGADRGLRRHPTRRSAGRRRRTVGAEDPPVRPTSVRGGHRAPAHARRGSPRHAGGRRIPARNSLPRRSVISSSVRRARQGSARRARAPACQQFLVCLRGSVSVVVDDGTSRKRSNEARRTWVCICRR